MKKQRNQQNRRGASVVEFAIVLPLFLVIVLGIIEFGRAMQVSQLVTNVAREGARRAIIPGSTNTDVQTSITTFLKETLNVDGANVTITITVTPASGTGIPGSTLADAQQGDQVTVTVSVPFDQVALLPGKFLSSTNLTGQCIMRHE